MKCREIISGIKRIILVNFGSHRAFQILEQTKITVEGRRVNNCIQIEQITHAKPVKHYWTKLAVVGNGGDILALIQ